jgi:pumilio family protein 6
MPSDEEEDEDVIMDDGTGYEEVPAEKGEGESGVSVEKKPRMTKTERAALHAAQPHRTTLLPSHPLLQDTLLPLWETARRADVPKEERKVAVRELWEAVKGRVAEVSRGHKGGRVLQTVCAFSPAHIMANSLLDCQTWW